MTKLKTANVQPAPQSAVSTVTTSPLAGKTCVVTGKLARYTRDEAERAIETHGGHAGSGVSKNTDFLIVGEKAGSKLDKATQLGVRILTEDEFMQMIA